MSGIDLSIIIVNWHSANYVLKCVHSIREQASVASYEVIVVDNASFDGCGERLAQEYPWVVFLQSQRNLGFAGANNLGAKCAHGAVLLFLNPDTEVLDGAIDCMYRHFQSLEEPGVVGCRLLNSDGSLQTSCVQSLPTLLNQVLDAEVLRRLFPRAKIFGTAALFEQRNGVKEVEGVSGACMMIRRDIFDLVGGFSADYFMYGEDLDLCFKTKQAGFYNYHVGEAVIVHHGGGSSKLTQSKFSTVMVRESVALFLRKSHGTLYCTCYKLALTGTAILRLVLLATAFPAWFVGRRQKALAEAFWKWVTILRWGIGLEGWTRQYEQVDHCAAYSDGDVEKSCAESAEN